jgi:magnesium transporter
MHTWVVTEDETSADPPLTRIAALASNSTPFWLDVEDPTDQVIDELAAILQLHPLAVDDAKSFDQRGSMQVFGDVAVLVGFGLDAERIEPIEVHAFMTQTYVVTLHRSASPALTGLREDGSVRTLLGGETARLLHHVATALHSGYPPCIDDLDARLSELGAEVLRTPDDAHLIEIAELNQVAGKLRRTLTPGRGLAERMAIDDQLPGSDDQSAVWMREIGDDLRQIVADIEALEERCFAMLQLHASLASNRLNGSSSQLAIVATIFLPITFLVGFFGQNFSVLVDPIAQGWVAFLVLGVTLNVLSIIATIVLLNRRGLREGLPGG